MTMSHLHDRDVHVRDKDANCVLHPGHLQCEVLPAWQGLLTPSLRLD